MHTSFEDLVYEYMTRRPLRIRNETELRNRVNRHVKPLGYKAGRSTFNAWLSETRRPPAWLVPALVEVLNLNAEEELALYRSLSVPAAVA